MPRRPVLTTFLRQMRCASRNLNKRPVRDMHFTMMNSVFGMAQTDFGQNLTGAPISIINEIVAT
jgi:hypothetical protein